MSSQIDFAKMGGLAPAIIQDAANGEILMLGFMNPDAYARTLECGYVTFFSRTRNQLWTKGETSGNRLRVVYSNYLARDAHVVTVDPATGRSYFPVLGASGGHPALLVCGFS